MNINELSEKNLHDAVQMYKTSVSAYAKFLPNGESSDEEIAQTFLDYENNGDFTYLFYDRGAPVAMATIEKSKAEIRNLFVNFDLIDEFFTTKYLEFIIKQFSAITRVFIWVVSLDTKACEMLEDYGFEYTGEQEYLSKENNILKFRYLFKRKK